MSHSATFRTATRRGRLDPVDSTRSALLPARFTKGFSVAVLSTFDMLLFGGTGDLVTRKLLPALYRRYAAGQVTADSRIYGIARTALSRSEYLAQAETACRGYLGKEFDAPHWEAFSGLLNYLKLDAG